MKSITQSIKVLAVIGIASAITGSSASAQLLITVDAIVAGIDALDEFLDPRRRRGYLQAVVAKLEDHVAPALEPRKVLGKIDCSISRQWKPGGDVM